MTAGWLARDGGAAYVSCHPTRSPAWSGPAVFYCVLGPMVLYSF